MHLIRAHEWCLVLILKYVLMLFYSFAAHMNTRKDTHSEQALFGWWSISFHLFTSPHFRNRGFKGDLSTSFSDLSFYSWTLVEKLCMEQCSLIIYCPSVQPNPYQAIKLIFFSLQANFALIGYHLQILSLTSRWVGLSCSHIKDICSPILKRTN